MKMIVANILKAYVKYENNTKNSTAFSNYTRNVPIEDDKIMISFDVTSLYTNITIIENGDQFIRKMATPQDKFLDLIH